MPAESLDNAGVKSNPGQRREGRSSEPEKNPTSQPVPALAAQRLLNFLPVKPADILALQRSIGNRAVQTMLLARRADKSGSRDANGVVVGAEAAVARAASSVGEPLPEAPRSQLEGSLHADLSSVRIHTGGESAEAAHAVGATAFTVGQDIHFGTGRYAPAESAGLHLLAHEVAHTVQQRGSAPALFAKLEVSSPGDPAEVEAEKAADAIVSGGSLNIKDAPAAIHRDPDPQAAPAPAPTGSAPAPVTPASGPTAPAPGSPAAGATATPEPSAAGAPSLTMGVITVTAYDGLLSASKFFNSQLTADTVDVPVGETSRTSADDLVKQEQGWEPFLQSKGTAPLDQAAVNQATVEMYKKATARDDMNKAAAEADQARDALGQIPEQMAESQRSAFLAKDDKLLEKITNTLGKALLVSSALLEIHEKCMEMVGWLNKETTHVDELVEKFGPFAEIAHKAVAAYEGLSSALTILHGGEGATEVEQATSRASAGLGLTGAAGSLTGMASAYMVYFGVLLSVGQTCLKVVGVIEREEGHKLNELTLSEGDLKNVDWSAEPRGKATYDFMVKVMHADSSNEIPTPIPEAVDKLITDSSEEFKAGTGTEAPTKGVLWWKHTDPDKLKYWLMKNRDNIWNMLYGGNIRPPNSAGGR
jgi:hypothetical protein